MVQSVWSKTIKTNEMIELIAKTNGKLSVGFDHCSDPVLSHMKKLYQWRDIENFIKQCHRYNVDVKTAMWIVGYPTETVTDILEYKKLFRLIKTYDVITSHSVVVCSINRNSSLLKNVQIDWHNPKDWISNTGLTKSMRIRRKNWVDNNLLALDQFYYRLETTQKREK
jgi:tRNA A37 methylthiotransferase MiaB